MQQSFLSNGSDESSTCDHRREKIDNPKKKMYDIELTFMNRFKRQIQEVHFGIQGVLLSLTNCEEGEGEKKRLPYNVLRSIQKNLKQMRNLRELIVQQNKTYAQSFFNRQKMKLLKNAQFKMYLKQLGNKRQELKQYIAKLQARVRKLEDSGYAQFVEYDVVVAEQPMIHFSYRCSTLILFVQNRNYWKTEVMHQIQKWNKFHNCNKGIGYRIRSAVSKKQNGEKEKESQGNGVVIPLLRQEKVSLEQALKTYLLYKYFINQLVIANNILILHRNKSRFAIQIQRLKEGIKSTREQIYKQQLTQCFSSLGNTMTRTDHLIYLKQMKNEIKQQVEKRIFLKYEHIKIYRSKSWERGTSGVVGR